jgi:hypothetical protein
MNTFSTLAGALGILVAGVFKTRYGLNAVFASSSVLNFMVGLIILYGVFKYTSRDIARAHELSLQT